MSMEKRGISFYLLERDSNMSKILGRLGWMTFGVVFFALGLETLIELGNVYYETEINGRNTEEVVQEYLKRAYKGWEAL